MVPPLKLEPREKLLKDCLAECALSIRPPLEIRFAGGWVRDKLLGQASNDIDAALSTLSGKDFGHIFLEFYNNHGAKYRDEACRLGITDRDLNKIVLVEEDAEKSKHLAVAKMKLFGLEVDLVNLRTEVYATDSRTPEAKMGTAEEDALRRDATINALFYNIHTDQIEDFTGKGLADLKNKTMRTPLDPHQTFTDDPLRVLRLIRFASRLDFTIDPAAQEAMKEPAIHLALRQKISRERVRAEIIKAFDGPHPAQALHYIHTLDLFFSCFAHPQDAHPPPPLHLPETSNLLTQILANPLLSHGLGLDQGPASLSWLLAAYTAWVSPPQQPAPPPDSACLALKEGMKATVHEAKLLKACLSHRSEILSLVSSIATSQPPPPGAAAPAEPAGPPLTPIPTRGQIGMTLRRWGPTWGHQVLFALLCQPSISTSASPSPSPPFEAFLLHLQQLSLDGTKALETRPLLDGRGIMQVLDRRGAGPGNRLAADVVMEWGLDHPDGDAGECAEMLAGRREEILGWEDRGGEGEGGRKGVGKGKGGKGKGGR